MKMMNFLRDWSLAIAMAGGALAYIVFVNIPALDFTHAFAAKAVSVLQPTLIFMMLFVTFCRMQLKDLKPQRWHFILLSMQIFSFAGLALFLYLFAPVSSMTRLLVETAMLCLICPTATAAAVITAKLGGDATKLITYTIMINLSVAVIAPLFVTLSNPVEGISLAAATAKICIKVFPLLMLPMSVATLVRYLLPGLHRYLVTKGANIPFILWLIALALAIAMTARAIAHSSLPLIAYLAVGAVSLVCCLMQFAIGRFVGARYGEKITGGQALGQKNTVFGIWFAYTFMTPVTAIAGGFYSLWHNIVNTIQLQRHNHGKK